MTALAAARDTWYQETRDTLRIPMADSAVIYQGGLVSVNAAGYAVPASDTADHKFAGMAIRDPQNPARGTYDNSAGDDGDMYVVVRRVGRARYVLAERTPAQNMLFAKVYVYDDQTVAVCREDVTNDIRCGYITKLPATTLAHDSQADFDSDEVEITFSGEPFDWLEGTSTAAPTTTTTTPQA